MLFFLDWSNVPNIKQVLSHFIPILEFLSSSKTEHIHKKLILIAFFSLFLSDINECKRYKAACQGGKCLNTLGSYVCHCNKSFILSADKSHCIGKQIIYIKPLFLIDEDVHYFFEWIFFFKLSYGLNFCSFCCHY